MKKVMQSMLLLGCVFIVIFLNNVSAETTTWDITGYIDYGVQSVTSTSAVVAVGYQSRLRMVEPGQPVADNVFELKYWEDGSKEVHHFPQNILMSYPERIVKTISDLKPGTKYYYQFHQEPVNSFTTLKENLNCLVNANSKFAFDIFKQLNATETGNVFISPLSISTALAMLYQGANSETKNEIAKALNYHGIDIATLNIDYKDLLSGLNKVDSFVTLNIANSIWYQEGFHVKSDFLNTNNDVFGAKVQGLDFTKADAADTINQWISDATQGLIDKMLAPPLSGVMYLIDAIYFKGAWTNPFSPKLTRKSTFVTESGKRNTVDMMCADATTEYGKGTDYSAVRLPYGNAKVSMYCILPAEGLPIDSFIQGLSVEKFNQIKQSLSTRCEFSLNLPKFKMAYGVKSLKNELNTLGMNKAFNAGQADFSGITAKPVWVDDVLHKAVIDVNEQGTVAAATTVVIIEEALRDDFHADRPFVFLIVDDTTGSILFMGKAADLVEY